MKLDSDELKLELLLGGVSLVGVGTACLFLFLGPRSLPTVLLLIPAMHVVSLSFAFCIAVAQGLVSVPPASTLRGFTSVLLVIASYPVSALIFVSIFFGLTPSQFLDFDDHSGETFSRLDWLRNDAAIPLGLFLSGLTIFLLTAVAVRVLVGRWPRRIWIHSILTVLVVVLVARPLARIGLQGVWVLLLTAYATFGALIGNWIVSAQKAALCEPAGAASAPK